MYAWIDRFSLFNNIYRVSNQAHSLPVPISITFHSITNHFITKNAEDVDEEVLYLDQVLRPSLSHTSLVFSYAN